MRTSTFSVRQALCLRVTGLKCLTAIAVVLLFQCGCCQNDLPAKTLSSQESISRAMSAFRAFWERASLETTRAYVVSGQDVVPATVDEEMQLVLASRDDVCPFVGPSPVDGTESFSSELVIRLVSDRGRLSVSIDSFGFFIGSEPHDRFISPMIAEVVGRIVRRHDFPHMPRQEAWPYLRNLLLRGAGVADARTGHPLMLPEPRIRNLPPGVRAWYAQELRIRMGHSETKDSEESRQ